MIDFRRRERLVENLIPVALKADDEAQALQIRNRTKHWSLIPGWSTRLIAAQNEFTINVGLVEAASRRQD